MSYRDYLGDKIYNSDFFGEGYFEYRRKTAEEKEKALAPLKKQLKSFDKVKNEIMNGTVSINKLSRLEQILKEEISLSAGYDRGRFSLSNTKELKEIFWYEGLDDVRFDVRRGYMHMPKYYLCEARSNYYGNYGVVYKDYYTSPDYIFEDPRFVRLMLHGHEHYFIRMSDYRSGLVEALTEAKMEGGKAAEQVLLDVGRYFLQLAWHEDQIIGWMVSEHFGLPTFREAMEVIYFNLGSDFCSVRQQITPEVKVFFRDVYKQPALLALIKKIESSEGNEFQSLEMKSRTWYETINKAFSALLQCKTEWGLVQKCSLPLYKVVFSNIFRLHLVVGSLTENRQVRQACKVLEKVSGEAIEDLVG